MERNADVFVNKQALHEVIGQLLEDLDTDIWSIPSSVKSLVDKEWIPKDIRYAIERTIEKSNEARIKIKEIHDVFKIEKRKKSTAIVNPHMKRIERLAVFNGGLYKPPEKIVIQEDDILSDFFKEWRKKQKPEART